MFIIDKSLLHDLQKSDWIGRKVVGSSGWRWCGNVWSVIEIMYTSDLICASTHVFLYSNELAVADLIKRQQSNVWRWAGEDNGGKLAFDDDAKSQTNWIGKLVIVSAVKYVLNWADQLNFNRSVIIKCLGPGLIIVWPSNAAGQQWIGSEQAAKSSVVLWSINECNGSQKINCDFIAAWNKSGALSVSCRY